MTRSRGAAPARPPVPGPTAGELVLLGAGPHLPPVVATLLNLQVASCQVGLEHLLTADTLSLRHRRVRFAGIVEVGKFLGALLALIITHGVINLINLGLFNLTWTQFGAGTFSDRIRYKLFCCNIECNAWK